jgi:hypothetical protein
LRSNIETFIEEYYNRCPSAFGAGLPTAGEIRAATKDSDYFRRAKMSFSGMGKTIDPIVPMQKRGATRRPFL